VGRLRRVAATLARDAAVLAFLIVAGVPVAAGAQPPVNGPSPQGLLPDAAFRATFRKYLGSENVFAPFYSWDADMALDLTVFRQGPNAVAVSSTFQTVGTKNIGSRIGVGGTGYFLGLGYVRARSDAFRLSSGLVHFSSHLTRDLDEKIEEERGKGAPVPLVDDPSEFNVIYVRGEWALRRLPLAPEITVTVQPINFRFNGGDADYVRPLYLGTRWKLWRGDRKFLTAETQQEFGDNAFVNVILVFGLSTREQPEERLQLFFSGSPGGNVHVSPQIGALRDGLAFGVRLHFKG